MSARIFVIVERSDCWRLEIYTQRSPLGRCTHEGPHERLIAIADQMATPGEEIHIVPRTASDWYPPTARYSCAPTRGE